MTILIFLFDASSSQAFEIYTNVDDLKAFNFLGLFKEIWHVSVFFEIEIFL
mgnify:CR=1 FL=1